MMSAVSYLEEVFNLRVVISFLLNKRGSVQLTRTESKDRNGTSLVDKMCSFLY